MIVRTKKLTRSYKVVCNAGVHKPRTATITFRYEDDCEWHHERTDFSFLDGSSNHTISYMGRLFNLADMIFIGKVAEKIVELKKDLNEVKREEKEEVKTSTKSKRENKIHYRIANRQQSYCKIKNITSMTRDVDTVTCKNCLRIMKKEGII